jgi:hypothetical protein
MDSSFVTVGASPDSANLAVMTKDVDTDLNNECCNTTEDDTDRRGNNETCEPTMSKQSLVNLILEPT